MTPAAAGPHLTPAYCVPVCMELITTLISERDYALDSHEPTFTAREL